MADPPSESTSAADPAMPVGFPFDVASVYEELRKAAQAHMKSERPGHTLSATALVHEAYLRLAAPRENPWQNRAHFYAAAAEAIRRILIDHARAVGRAKRGGNRPVASLDDPAMLPAHEEQTDIDILALDAALCRLKEQDARAAQVVNLRYFAGLSFADTAAVMRISERTAKNDWAFARAWLARELADSRDG